MSGFSLRISVAGVLLAGVAATLDSVAAPAAETPAKPAISLTLIPPSPVTDQITLEMRGAVWNHAGEPSTFNIAFYLDKEERNCLLQRKSMEVAGGSAKAVSFRWPTRGNNGRHTVIAVAEAGSKRWRIERPLEIIPSPHRSPGSIDGAWVNFSLFSEIEGKHWLEELHKMTEDDWREQVRGMHQIGMDIIVIHEVFRSGPHHGQHDVPAQGYQGKAFYPSKLFPGRMQIASQDPVEAVLSEADRLKMHVFVGVGMYAGFDYTPGSLDWHKRVASELWERYGHHASFYGWYVPETQMGDLRPPGGGDTELYRREVVQFFREFQRHCRALTPDKPLMIAPNTIEMHNAVERWRPVLEHCDIICPFGFHRFAGGEKAARGMRELCDETGTHLWMDMETFVFEHGGSLIPRPIEGVIDDLRRYTDFDKVLTYGYTGLWNAPDAVRKPGGEPTVRLYQDYRDHLKQTRELPASSPGERPILAPAPASTPQKDAR
jgi:hypothetical protein